MQLVGAVAASGVGLIMLAVFAIDIQLLLGGRRCEISPEVYVFAAVQLFADVMLIYFLVLVIVPLLVGLYRGCGCSCCSATDVCCGCSGGCGGAVGCCAGSGEGEEES